MWTEIAAQISQVTGKTFRIEQRHPVGGGCINQGYRLQAESQSYFIKLNQADQLTMFESEAIALQQMAATQTIQVPEPICWGVNERHSYLVLSWLNLGKGNSTSWRSLGRQLARMHSQGQNQRFGWERNNTIGSTPQINIWSENWADFFAEHRIGYQLKLAQRRGGHFPDTTKVVTKVRNLLADRNPQPALVHGDLWSGNAAILDSGEPVIFDPATYYGDREVDLAMTELFGGFPTAFYQGYTEISPLAEGYQQRKTLYNLYHILNHFNLFGGSYAAQANQMINQLFNP
ncbi:MAG: fructosamine kinase family protein [Snowella sp.]|nr:fructosamine kinase family protein [Snowella sp.]